MDGVVLSWPVKYDVFGVRVSATTYEEAQEAILRAARVRKSATVTHTFTTPDFMRLNNCAAALRRISGLVMKFTEVARMK